MKQAKCYVGIAALGNIDGHEFIVAADSEARLSSLWARIFPDKPLDLELTSRVIVAREPSEKIKP